MNKQELIKQLKEMQVLMDKSFDDDKLTGRYNEEAAKRSHNAYSYAIMVSEQLDEPSREECKLVGNEYNICNCCEYNMRNLIKDIVTGCDKDECDYDCDGAVVHQIFWTSKYMNYCPNCGAKIKRGKNDERI